MVSGIGSRPPSPGEQAAKTPSTLDESQAEKTSSQRLVLEGKLADELRLRRFTESVLDARQEELEHQELENKKLSKKMVSLQKELADARGQLTEARHQTKAKVKQIQDAKDHIFRLQPRRKDITESEAQETYKKLCGNVQRWVENRLPPVLDEMESGRLGDQPVGAPAVRFAALIREPAGRCLGLHQSDEYHVIAVVMYYIFVALFAKPLYWPLDGSDDDATIRWIDELESTMSKLPRDFAHCREWRSETLTALTTQPLYKSRREKYIGLLSEDLAFVLSPVVPGASHADLQSSVRRTIVEPAADFAQRLQLAPSIFSLKWPARNASSRLEVYECINLASGGRVLDVASSALARQRVTYLFDVAPGLFVERVELGKKAPLKAVCRPNVLVYAGDGEVPQRPTLIRWLCGNIIECARGPLPRTAMPRSKIVSSVRFSKL